MRFSPVFALCLIACGGGPVAVDSGLPDAGTDSAMPRDAGTLDPLRLDCEPLVPEVCALPFPSMWFLTPDATTATGYRVHFGQTTLPRTRGTGRQPIEPTLLDDRDGFSVNASILAFLPGATATGLPSPDTIATSIEPTSATVILDAETGELVPHFSEIDMSTVLDASRALIIRPVVPLEHARRYIVAIRRVVDVIGYSIAPSPVFTALRDGTNLDHEYVTRRRADFEDIFGRLGTAGIERGTLQLAWDFVTASEENDVARMISARDQALTIAGTQGPEYVIDQLERDVDAHTAMRIQGRMTVPLFLDSATPGSRLHFDADGNVAQNGTAEFPFLVRVPVSATPDTPARPLQYGHGLVGTRLQADAGWLAEFADANRYLVFAVDWTGMAEDDVVAITLAISTGNIGDFRTVPDRLTQGLVNALLAMRLMRGRFGSDPMLQVGGRSLIDGSAGFYTGDSQGGIFGATYMALSTDVTRGILGVPGQPYNLLLNRSVDFDPYLALLRVGFNDGVDIQIVMSLLQQLWDRAEPGSFSRHIAEDMFPGTPAHQVILQVGIGDHQVTPLGAHIMARAIGARSIAPQTRPIFAIEEVAGPYLGSGIVEFDFGNPPAPITNVPPRDGDDPHGRVRRNPAALAQTQHFFETGEIINTCTDICDPE